MCAFNITRVDSYRLSSSGGIESIPSERLSEFFISTNILGVYFIQKKRIYIWIGENASQEKRKYIPTIEKQMRLNLSLVILC